MKEQFKKPKRSLLVLFGLKLRHYRFILNLTQEEFASIVGIHRTYLGQIERGEKNITLKNVEKIMDALKIDVLELFDFKGL